MRETKVSFNLEGEKKRSRVKKFKAGMWGSKASPGGDFMNVDSKTKGFVGEIIYTLSPTPLKLIEPFFDTPPTKQEKANDPDKA